MQAQVPYENHDIPTEQGGAQGLSGLFDMAGEIVKDSVGLVKEIGGDIAELGHELADMVGDEQLPNDYWLETEWGIMMERRAQMLERDRDMGR